MRRVSRKGIRSGISTTYRTAQLLSLATIATLTAHSATATVYQWKGVGGSTSSPTTGNWNTAANWSTNSVPASSATTEIDFLGAGGFTSTDDISGALQLNILNLSSTGTSTVAATGTGSLNVVTNGAVTPTIVQNTGAGTFVFSAPVSLSANTAINQASGAEIDFTGNITASGSALSLTNTSGSGVSTIKFAGANTFSGLTINPRVTAIAGLSTKTNTLGSGTVTLAGGVVKLQGQQSSGSAVQQTLNLSGYNQNVIVPAGSSTANVPSVTTTSIDANQVLYQKGFVGGSSPFGLNTTGAYTSQYNSNIDFQLGYTSSTITGNTILQIAQDGSFHTGDSNSQAFTLNASSQKAYQTVNILSNGTGYNNSAVTVTFTFSDNSTETQTLNTQDWYYNGSQSRLAVGGNSNTSTRLGSVRRTGTANNDNYPVGLYEDDFTLSPSDQSKTLVSVGFSMPTSAFNNNQGSFNVYALSGAGFNSSPTTLATQSYANNVNVTADSTIDVSNSLAAVAGNLTIGSSKLSLTSSDASASAYSLTLAATTLTGNSKFDVASSTGGGTGTLILGALNDGGTARSITINPSGTGTIRLSAPAAGLTTGTAINLQHGTLQSNNGTALGTTAQITLATGTNFVIGASQQISSISGPGGTVSFDGATLKIGSSDNLSSSFGGNFTGAGTLDFPSTGTITLSGASTLSGTDYNTNGLHINTSAVVEQGTVVVNGPSIVTNGTIVSGPLGTSNVVVTSGATGTSSGINLGTTPGLVFANPIYIGSSGPAVPTLGGLNNSGVNTYSGNIKLGTGSTGDFGHDLVVGASSGGEVSFTGNILSNAGNTHSAIAVTNLSGTGSATVRFTGANTFAGGTTINSNVTLAAGPSTSTSTLGLNKVTLNGGRLALQGQLTPGMQQTLAINSASFNADTILDQSAADGSQSSTGTPTSTIDTGNLFYENGYKGNSNGLPSGGAITSATTAHQFQLASYTDYNTLRFAAGETGVTKTLSLVTPAAFQTLDFLSTSQNTAQYQVTLHFTDNSTDVLGMVNNSDWYGGNPATNAVTGLNPVAQGDGSVANFGGALTIQENDLNLSAADRTKLISSIDFTATNISGNSIEIYAVSGASTASSTPLSTQTYANNIVVNTDSTIDVSGSLAAVVGTLQIGGSVATPQVLSVTSVDATSSAYSLTTGAVTFVGSSSTFNIANSAGGGKGTLNVGALDDMGNVQMINKTGNGALTLTAAATSLVNGTIVNINGGTLNSNATDALGTFATVNIASGATFGIGANQTIGALNDIGIAPVNSSVKLNGNILTIGTITDANSAYSGNISDGTATGGGIIKAGAGTLTLLGTNTYSGNTTVRLGTLVIGSTGALPINTTLNIQDPAAVTFDRGTGPRIVGIVSALNIAQDPSGAWLGKLDLRNNDLIIHNGNLPNVTSQIAQGYNHGNFGGTAGIVSSTAAGDTLHTLGSIQATTGSIVDGVSLSSTDVAVKYTYYGDADLSGTVTGNDYTQIDNGYNTAGATGWQNGDFNYDGFIDGSDYSLIDNAFNRQGASLAASSSAMVAVNSAEITSGTSVPEPASVSVIGLSALTLLNRRRRRQ